MRKYLSKEKKEIIKWRQKGKCICCIEKISCYHHIYPVFLGGSQNINNNIIGLCQPCHTKLHLADPEICMQIYEYIYFLCFKKLPEDPYNLENAQKVINIIKKDHI